MTDERNMVFAALVAFAILVLGGTLLISPNVEKLRGTRVETASLRPRIAELRTQTVIIERLADDLLELNRISAGLVRTIPSEPDVAMLTRRIESIGPRPVSLTMDTTADPRPAAGTDAPERVQPITIELTGSFQTIFGVVRSLGLTDDLVRVVAIRIDAPAGDAGDDPVLTAAVGVEMVYDPR
jgi:Tfp pilus assembly protein PilO